MIRKFMISNRWDLIGVILFSLPCLSLAANSVDSVGLQKRNNNWYILHEIEAGETLFGLSQRYGGTVEEILDANPKSDQGLSIGAIIQIPYLTGAYILHGVAQGETLYSISRKYGISVGDLEKWNRKGEGEGRSDIHIGQELKIYECNSSFNPGIEEGQGKLVHHRVVADENLYNISKQYGVTIDNLKSWNDLDDDNVDLGQVLIIYAIEADMNVKNSTSSGIPEFLDQDGENMPGVITNLPLKEERGLAELILDTENTEKYLALHRNAPPGTILIVRNELNNQVVFVRVIGKLPDTGVNDKVIVKISEAAWKSINAVNPKLRIKVSYLESF